jgi:hypothetical protein
MGKKTPLAPVLEGNAEAFGFQTTELTMTKKRSLRDGCVSSGNVSLIGNINSLV